MGGQKGWGIGLCMAAILVGALLGSNSKAPTGFAAGSEPPATSLPTTASVLSIHVSGWVVSPGVVIVQEGAIVADAVAAAGGAKPGAALHAINLAGPVADGDQIQVPGPGSVAEPSAAEATGASGLVSLNRADATALQGLPGVGPVLAERIVAYRESNGPFETVEDLLDVPGIGEAKLAALRDQVSVP